MTDARAVTIRRCIYCAKEWELTDGPSRAELCSFQHAHSNGWYRTKHRVDTLTITIPDDISGLWENRS